MKNNHTDIYDLFLRHSQKELSEIELNDFCERLVNDEDFKNQFEEYEISRQFFIQQELFEVEDIINDFNHNPPPSNTSYKYWLGGSLLFTLLVIGIGTAFLPKESDEETETINSVRSNPINNTKKAHKHDDVKEEIVIQHKVDEPTSNEKIEKAPTESTSPTQNTSITVVPNHKEHASQNVKKDSTVITHQNDQTAIVEPKTITQPSIETVANTPCPTISFVVNTQKTCREDATGSIHIKNIKGGSTPYEFIIEDEQSSSPTFNALEAGTYSVSVKDDNGCLHTQSTVISSKTCINEHYEFAYSYQDSWTIPVRQNGTISFYNQQGKKMITLNLEDDVETEWNGLDFNGNSFPTGLYPFVIELENEKLSGSLSIYP